MVLAASRHMFVQPVLSMDQSAWNAAHVAAFAFFDGVPARIVPDNIKTGVAKPDLYDPKINRAYAELGAHYGVLIDPACKPTRSSEDGPARPTVTAASQQLWQDTSTDSNGRRPEHVLDADLRAG